VQDLRKTVCPGLFPGLVRVREQCDHAVHTDSTFPLTSQHDVLPQLSMPYWLEDDSNKSAKVKLAGVVALTLGTTGVRCNATPCIPHN